MSIGKVAAGCAGFLLLLPGLCFFGVGIAGLFSKDGVITMIGFIAVGAVILGGAGLLFREAFRPPDTTPPS